MPLYEYQCTNCGNSIEVLQKVSEAPTTVCPECKKDQLKRIVSATRFQLKGTGWYVTDFKNKKETGAKGSSESESKTSDSKTADPETPKKTSGEEA